MLIHVATMVYSQGLFQFIPTFPFLSIARVNLTRDKLPNRKVICNLDKKKLHRSHVRFGLFILN